MEVASCAAIMHFCGVVSRITSDSLHDLGF